MAERMMARRRKHQQRHRRNTATAWIVGAFCMTALLLYAAFGCIDYLNKLAPRENHPDSLPGLVVKEQGETSSPQSLSADYGDGIDWNLLLVNRWNTIPERYTVKLKEIPGGEQVDERIYDPLMKMLEAAQDGNCDETPHVISGYRTQEAQQSLYDDEVNKYKLEGYSDDEAKAEAEKWVALPGTSEHQLGLAVDIEGATYDVFFWLQENSYKYGFVFRYPGNKSDITGTVEEVWHYRYVGVEAATEMYEQGLCLEEYVEQRGILE